MGCPLLPLSEMALHGCCRETPVAVGSGNADGRRKTLLRPKRGLIGAERVRGECWAVSSPTRGLEPGEPWPAGAAAVPPRAVEGALLDLRCRRPGEDDRPGARQWGPERRIPLRDAQDHGSAHASPLSALRPLG